MARDPGDSYIAVFRKICRNPIVWPKPYGVTQAWLWLNMHARVTSSMCFKRGQMVATRAFLAEKWGWLQNDEKSLDLGKVRRFLEALKNAPDGPMVEVEVIPVPRCRPKGEPKAEPKRGPKKKPKSKPKTGPKMLLITIVNYEDYQSSSCDTRPKLEPKLEHKTEPKTGPKLRPKTEPKTCQILCDAESLQAPKNGIKRMGVQEEECVPASENPKREPTRRPKAPKSKKAIQEMLDMVDLERFIAIYGPQGLDVHRSWERFCNYVMNGSSSKPFPNPSNYRDANLAFHENCKRDIEKGWNLLKSSRPKPPWEKSDDKDNDPDASFRDPNFGMKGPIIRNG